MWIKTELLPQKCAMKDNKEKTESIGEKENEREGEREKKDGTTKRKALQSDTEKQKKSVFFGSLFINIALYVIIMGKNILSFGTKSCVLQLLEPLFRTTKKCLCMPHPCSTFFQYYFCSEPFFSLLRDILQLSLPEFCHSLFYSNWIFLLMKHKIKGSTSNTYNERNKTELPN